MYTPLLALSQGAGSGDTKVTPFSAHSPPCVSKRAEGNSPFTCQWHLNLGITFDLSGIFDPQEEHLTLWVNFDISGWPLACWDDLWSFGMTFYILLVFHLWNVGVTLDGSRKKVTVRVTFDLSVTHDLLDHFTFQANPWIFYDLWHRERLLCDLWPVLDILPLCNLWCVSEFLHLSWPLRSQWPSTFSIIFDLSDNFLLFDMTFDHSGCPLTFCIASGDCLWLLIFWVWPFTFLPLSVFTLFYSLFKRQTQNTLHSISSSRKSSSHDCFVVFDYLCFQRIIHILW